MLLELYKLNFFFLVNEEKKALWFIKIDGNNKNE
jgi:hypothetical protein